MKPTITTSIRRSRIDPQLGDLLVAGVQLNHEAALDRRLEAVFHGFAGRQLDVQVVTVDVQFVAGR